MRTNAAGQKYEADGAAGIHLEEDSRAFLEDINPGNSVNGIVVFDIPKDGQIVKLELHDSAFSGESWSTSDVVIRVAAHREDGHPAHHSLSLR